MYDRWKDLEIVFDLRGSWTFLHKHQHWKKKDIESANSGRLSKRKKRFDRQKIDFLGLQKYLHKHSYILYYLGPYPTLYEALFSCSVVILFISLGERPCNN